MKTEDCNPQRLSQPSASRELSPAGTARLWIVAPVVVMAFFYFGFLDYFLPLYFGALEERAKAAGDHFPADMWSKYQCYLVSVWIICPFLAGLVSRRYGERRVWSFAQLALLPVTLLLLYCPTPLMIPVLAAWIGVGAVLVWVGGISLVQVVHPDRKGLANAIMMVGLATGSLLAPICGRAMLYWRELDVYVRKNNWSDFWLSVLSLREPTIVPGVDDCRSILWLLTFVTLLCGILIGLWGQRPGRFQHELPPDWGQTVRDLGRLARDRKFWILVLSISFLGGTIFQGANQFLPYRAEELGLKQGAADIGWVWLNLLKTLIWIPGGFAVGMLAGRKAGAMVGALMLGGFAVGAFGMGISDTGWQLFVSVAVLELCRQFMRWGQSGYLSEHLPDDLRATVIGCSVAISGLSGTMFAWIANYSWNPAMSSAYPLFAACACGAIGCVALLVFNRFEPVGEPTTRDAHIAAEAPSLPDHGIIET